MLGAGRLRSGLVVNNKDRGSEFARRLDLRSGVALFKANDVVAAVVIKP